MAFDPITAVVDLVKTGIDKFFPTAASEADKMKFQNDMTMFTLNQVNDVDSKFRDFVIKYEGEAGNLPTPLIYLRSVIRPGFTILVGYLDWLYFTASVTWTADKSDLLKAVNLIVLLFWFGERAITNSGIIDILKAKMAK